LNAARVAPALHCTRIASVAAAREDEPMPTYTDIELEIDDPVAVLRLNRPDKLNAFTYHTLSEIRHAVDACVADRRVVGIVITGAGRGFCAGLDAATLAEVTGRDAAPAATDRPASSCIMGRMGVKAKRPMPIATASASRPASAIRSPEVGCILPESVCNGIARSLS